MARGFTIVELIVVIILLSVLSVVALSRSVGASAFEAAVLSDFVLEEWRFAQRLASVRQDSPVQLQLAAGATELTASLVLGGTTTVRQRQWETAATLSNSGTVLSSGQLATFSYAGSGQLVAASWNGAVLDPTLGVQIDVNGENPRVLCLYPSGYGDAAVCQ